MGIKRERKNVVLPQELRKPESVNDYLRALERIAYVNYENLLEVYGIKARYYRNISFYRYEALEKKEPSQEIDEEILKELKELPTINEPKEFYREELRGTEILDFEKEPGSQTYRFHPLESVFVWSEINVLYTEEATSYELHKLGLKEKRNVIVVIPLFEWKKIEWIAIPPERAKKEYLLNDKKDELGIYSPLEGDYIELSPFGDFETHFEEVKFSDCKIIGEVNIETIERYKYSTFYKPSKRFYKVYEVVRPNETRFSPPIILVLNCAFEYRIERLKILSDETLIQKEEKRAGFVQHISPPPPPPQEEEFPPKPPGFPGK